MKAHQKALALLLVLSVGLSLTSCSTIQSVIGGIGKEDPSVAGNKPAGDPGEGEQADISGTGESFELYGIKVTKQEVEEQGSKKVFDLGGGIYSDVHDILIFDENGDELIVFNSGKPAKDYLDNLQIEPLPEYVPQTMTPGSTCWAGFSFGQLGVYNWTDSEVPIFDLECSTLQISQLDRKSIDVEKLGRPTAACVQWGKYAGLLTYLYWKCDGFYIEGLISGMPEISGDSYYIIKFTLARFNTNQQLTAQGTATTSLTGPTTYLSLVASEFGWDDVWVG